MKHKFGIKIKAFTAMVLAIMLAGTMTVFASVPELPPDGGGQVTGGANTTTYDYSGTNAASLTADGEEVSSDSETLTSTTSEENVALASNSGILKLNNTILEKSGDSSNADNCNFYGINSVILALNEGSCAYISDSELSSDSDGSNGIFATDYGTAFANNVSINTTADNSRGLDATYGGTIIGNLLDISTLGSHCAALATDRGGGYISVEDSTLSTAGSGSPLIYSTGTIEVNNVTGEATGSQIAGMEGLNKIIINNSNLSSTITGKTASDPIADAVIIYQSMSGDAETGSGDAAVFEAADSTLTTSITSGAFFYCTNTVANIVLSNTTLNFDSDNVNLLMVQGNDANSWGTAGSNGADITFTGLSETLSGNIDVDTISSLDMYLLEGTTYTGATTITTNSVNTDVSDNPIIMNIDGTSTWVLTSDSTISVLNLADGGKIVDQEGKTVSIIVNGETVVIGESDITLTVTGTYSQTVTTDSTNALTGATIDRSEFDAYFGTSSDITSEVTSATEGISGTLIAVISGVGALVIAGIATTTVMILRRKKKK